MTIRDGYASKISVLRPYQVEVDAAALSAYDEGRKSALVVMATGLGKSITAAWFARRWKRRSDGKRVIFLVDTIEATLQARKKFIDVMGTEFTTGAMCSRVCEDLDAEFLFTTFDSAWGAICRLELSPDDFGLVVVDESHHAAALTYERTVRRFENAFWYAMTATLERMDGKDIRDIFGDPVYTYSLAAALADNEWLATVTYKVMHSHMNLAALRLLVRRIESGDRTVTREKINRSLFLVAEIDAVVRIIRAHQGPDTRTIIFCTGKDHAREAGAALEGAVIYHSGTKVVPGDPTPLDDFRSGSISEIIAIDMLNESVDVPEADLIVFWRSTDSHRIWLQQLGRGLRRESGSVVVLDFVANCERVLAVREFMGEIDILFEESGETGRRDATLVVREAFSLTITDEIVDLLKLLDQLDPYCTIEEAMVAVQQLAHRPRTWNEYVLQGMYKADPRLSSIPEEIYAADWVSWPHFLGAEKYKTVEEAIGAAGRVRPPFVNSPDYEKRCRSVDPRLPKVPSAFYNGRGWVSWPHFLGYIPYKMISEAMQAVKLLVPRPLSAKEYRNRDRTADRKLPNRPQVMYAEDGWDGWRHFLGTEKYDTLTEAMAAVQRMVPPPITSTEYRRRCVREDPRLPSKPGTVYSSCGWINWPHYLGTVTYNVYGDAANAVQCTEIPFKSRDDYLSRFSDIDPRLPSNPEKVYKGKGWVNWKHYLRIGPYQFIEESMGVIQRTDPPFTGSVDYRDRRRGVDMRLPSHPKQIYGGKGWVSFDHYLGIKR
jgi:superfamily II DNA or RNA helicase